MRAPSDTWRVNTSPKCTVQYSTVLYSTVQYSYTVHSTRNRFAIVPSQTLGRGGSGGLMGALLGRLSWPATAACAAAEGGHGDEAQVDDITAVKGASQPLRLPRKLPALS